jgi:PA14 domain
MQSIERYGYPLKAPCIALTVIVCAAMLLIQCTRQPVTPMVGPRSAEVLSPGHVSKLQPGLTVRYYYTKFRHIDEMPSGKRAEQWGRPGKPIMIINHRFGQGVVFDSGASQRVGLKMSGYIHLANVGLYHFQARSNDGVRVWIGGDVVINDPDVHSDRLSPLVPLEIHLAGWYPFELNYFQNKGTATLELYWQPPGAAGPSIVPAEAYASLR